MIDGENKLEKATFASGCFWCSEAVFNMVNGVEEVVSGYTGGHTVNPSYKQVCSGNTGHAEAIQIAFNPDIITYEELLKIFWRTHDPTTLNRQGDDVGTQYRSAIFYHNDVQKQASEKFKTELDHSGAWDNSIVTEIVPISTFYKAESYHQKYFSRNPNQSYCSFVIAPKIEKFENAFKNLLKK